MVQVLFHNNDANFQDDSPILTARSVHSWFEEHEDALRHLLWLVQSPSLNIIEPLVSFREQGEKHIPSIISQERKRRRGVQGIPLETIQNLHESIPGRIQPVLQANGGPTPY